MAPYQRIECCRVCGARNVVDVMAFGEMPIADRLVRGDEGQVEFVAPLTLAICEACGLCQIRETLEPSFLFGDDYPYYSSVSPALVSHFHASAQQIMRTHALTPKDLVVEAASNDGYMLSAFQKAGIPVLGIDPAAGPVREARRRGIETRQEFFTESLARQLVNEGRRAKVFLANNVLAHVMDPNGFVSGVRELLTGDGVAVFEFPYLLDLISGRAFDTIYHQHLLYLSVNSVAKLLEQNGLVLNDVVRTNVHGGSLRVTASKIPLQSSNVFQLLAEEEARGLHAIACFREFVDAIQQIRTEARRAIGALKERGRTVAAYGAAAKAATSLAFFGFTTDEIEYVVDKSEWKHGWRMPVTGLPIVSRNRLRTHPPDALLILAWNFAREIMADNQDFMERGGAFFVPIPSFQEVKHDSVGVWL